MSYRQINQLNLPEIDREILDFWEKNDIFKRALNHRQNKPQFVFYEGPPSVNGMPGIHHVVSRTLKDLFCRYQSLKGHYVPRKAGWDTHGLPIELNTEKRLGITKDDIGTKISVDEYNLRCREDAMRYIDVWHKVTTRMGYWVDMHNPYTTFDNNYLETCWFLLQKLYNKGLVYKGYTIQPYSPAAGTGLSSHELSYAGTYREVKDVTAVAQFKIIKNSKSEALFNAAAGRDVFILSWTTTPWTLPSNTALAVGAGISYTQINTFNPYTFAPVSLILATDLVNQWFKAEAENADFAAYTPGAKIIPWQRVGNIKGSELAGMRYEQLMPYVQPTDGDAFLVVTADFVSTTDGTGVVHIAPCFGADDMQTAKKKGLGSLKLVNLQGRFLTEVTDFANRPVKNYDNEPEDQYRSVDIDITIKLKQENKAFDVRKHAHNYPHCWRTDKPIIYYPLDSWFIKTTAFRERLVELNKTINWKPESTGTGRFGNWLETLVDWNLSRSRFWGTPIPIWRTADGNEQICIGSVAELKSGIETALASGKLTAEQIQHNQNYLAAVANGTYDLHRPHIDRVSLVTKQGQIMHREPDLMDVWFDSGAMPYAQQHWPFNTVNNPDGDGGGMVANFPADFIAEGVDQTRGWFYTLHALSVMLFDSVAYKNVISTGLVLDKNGEKMSKSKGNVIDPFAAMDEYGADAVRWYIITNAQPWDNLKFDFSGLAESRKFFATLYNTYSFFALYANVDDFAWRESEIPLSQRPEIDRWIISQLNTLTLEVDTLLADYEPSKAFRLIETFVDDHLSNWYVRLCRRRFWKGDYQADKIAAYQTLYTCLERVAVMMSPVAPFFAEWLFKNLNNKTQRIAVESVHMADFPEINSSAVDKDLEERMQMAQTICSMVLALRKKQQIKVRQPLQKMLVPVINTQQIEQLQKVSSLILAEVNVKQIELVNDTSEMVKKTVRPDFKILGRKMGKHINALKMALENLSQPQIAQFEKEGNFDFTFDGDKFTITFDEVQITAEDIEGWLVNTQNCLTVALDVTITPELENEGVARELVKHLQSIRKDKNLQITDRIMVQIQAHPEINSAVEGYNQYIKTEILADSLVLVSNLFSGNATIQIDDFEIPVNLTAS